MSQTVPAKVTARITPRQSMGLLSQQEVAMLQEGSSGGLYELFRRCSLAVLSCGASHIDDGRQLDELFPDFHIAVVPQERGIKLAVQHAPASAFVDGEIIAGIREHLFAVLRDIVYVGRQLEADGRFDLDTPSGITNAVFHILRNAKALEPNRDARIAVCWGGHSIGREEYDYSKEVGHELGLRGLDICTGCGAGAMKGPMKGAALGHRKQRIADGRYIGVSEPGIIASESPNPIVSDLIILPDIEKRLEAFVRLGHGIIVFPGGVGTAEELLYLLGLLLHPANAGMPFPLVLSAPAASAGYFEQIDEFIAATRGSEGQGRYQIIVDDAAATSRALAEGIEEVFQYRREHADAYCFNWLLNISPDFQQPFAPTHANMAAQRISRDQPVHELAATLRRVFSGIVAGNVKADGIAEIEAHGRYQLRGEADIMARMDRLLQSFVAEGRMKIEADSYTPCYELVY